MLKLMVEYFKVGMEFQITKTQSGNLVAFCFNEIDAKQNVAEI